ncbi:MAG: phage tail tape measure protein, partial [Muribaculaceae bacterium]|nr:phage tail tape measure protein [Muribaculaceae bacterium]
DGVAAAQVLTTAMNQYGVSLEDPTAASEEMARMMNVMAAAGQAGSAELPAISAALQQCGMAAKAANVSFEETNAAIQVLDKAGKKASEGGVALRNVLGQLGKGRFVEKQAAEELQKAGIDVTALGDNTKSLKERLEMLKPMLNDSALLSKFFGVENANAARALIQGTDALEDFTTAVTGTSSATDQAAIVMDSYAERQARVNQKIEDFKISIFQATGDFTLWAGAISSAAVPIAQLLPLLTLIAKGIGSIIALNWAGMWATVVGWVRSAAVSFAMMNGTLSTTNMISLGFIGNMGRAALAVIRFGTVGIFNAIKGLISLGLSFITGGAASVTFAATASTSFAAFSAAASTACSAVTVAISSIPIVGWIAGAITLIGVLCYYFETFRYIVLACFSPQIALVAYLWNTSATFRAVLKGTWASFQIFFSGLSKLAGQVFGAIGDLLKSCFNLDAAGISSALTRLKSIFSDYGKLTGNAFNDAYDAEITESKKKETSEKRKNKTTTPQKTSIATVVATPTEDPTAGTLSTGGGSAGGSDKGDSTGKIKNITISIDKLIENFTIHTATMSESTEQLKAVVLDTLMGALNDTQLVTE